MSASQPGWVDLQVNGYAGVDFSSPGLRVDDVHAVTRRLRSMGVAAYCPTLITAPESVYAENLAVIAEAMRDREKGRGILGIHLEGPCLNPEAAGAHPRSCIRGPDIGDFDRWQAQADGRIVLHTLAPELPGALAYIREVVSRGVRVSLGHHLADAATIREALLAGARSCTHLGNGVPNLLHRFDNPILLQLAEAGLEVMFIPDGHHLPAHMLKLIAGMKQVRQCIAVSDCAPIAGMPPGIYTLWGSTVHKHDTGLILNQETHTLAGSSLTLFDCMNVLAASGLYTEEDLWAVGRDNALRYLGMECADLPGDSPELRFEDDKIVHANQT